MAAVADFIGVFKGGAACCLAVVFYLGGGLGLLLDERFDELEGVWDLSSESSLRGGVFYRPLVVGGFIIFVLAGGSYGFFKPSFA